MTRRLLLGFTSLCAIGAIQAQGPVAGYTLLNTPCAAPGHYYYISTAKVNGLGIAGVVNDFRTKTALPVDMAYAAAIATAAENLCIQNGLIAYNTANYPNPLAPALAWNDPRNAWIGFTDAAMENNFVWSNGQPNCNSFTNWNRGEPNNFASNVSNGEDYTEMLIMQSYAWNGNANDINNPLGKWNDWFNNNITTTSGQILGTASLPVVIEVGPQECRPPTNRGTLGCSHGYWKNAKDAAWGTYTDERTAAGSFVAVFNITEDQASVRGVLGDLSMQDALELQAGGYNQVAKQGVAALLNAFRGFYPYTTDEVITAVKQMFNTGTATLPIISLNGTSYGGTFTTPQALASTLDLLNNLGCPLNNKGAMEETSAARQIGGSVTETVQPDKQFSISGYPNPSRGAFSIQINGLSTERVSVKVTDASGRLVEQRTNLAANQVLSIGNTYNNGVYYVEVAQGTKKQQVKMVKQ